MKDGKPSATAALILKAVLFTAYDQNYGNILPARTRELSELIAQNTIGLPHVFFIILRNRLFRAAIRLTELFLNPGFILHVATRKALINKLAMDAFGNGYDQLIVVGAGHDTLAIRTASVYEHISCLEVDHPATQTVKKEALGGNSPPNFIFISADLSNRSIAEVLKGHPRFDSNKKTVVVIEGVFMYLHGEVVEKFLAELLTLFPIELRCIFTFMDQQSNGDIQFHTANKLVKWWLARKQERFLWGCPKDQLPHLIENLGFKNVGIFDEAEFLKSITNSSTSPFLAKGELVCVASR